MLVGEVGTCSLVAVRAFPGGLALRQFESWVLLALHAAGCWADAASGGVHALSGLAHVSNCRLSDSQVLAAAESKTGTVGKMEPAATV